MTLIDKAFQFTSEWLTLNRAFYQAAFSKRKVQRFESENILELHDEVVRNAQPVFVLSTGRAGTRFLYELLRKSGEVRAYHELLPELRYHSQEAYNKGLSKSREITAMFDAARYEFIRNAYIERKVYVELNPGITFFAFQIAHLFPKAKFVHLHRHPLEFIESGLSRNWYDTGSIIEEGRLRCGKAGYWEALSQPEKIALLWKETNKFIEGVKELFSDRFITLSSNDVFKSEPELMRVVEYAGARDLSEAQVRKHMKYVVNAQKGKKILNEDEKDLVWNILRADARKYNYELK